MLAHCESVKPEGDVGPRVLVADSGVGGLSICRAIRRHLPGATLDCVIDDAWFPYGEKEPALLDDRLLGLLRPLVVETEPDAIVIGCNTASTRVLPHLRAAIKVPIVGVVPAVKPAAAMSSSKVIGLLATPATVASPYVDDLIARFAGDCEVIRVGSLPLVELAELRLRGGNVAREQVSAAVGPLLAHRRGGELDTVVLGCTHFPLLREELATAMPERVRLIDSEDAIARRVADLTGSIERTRIAGALYFTGGNDDLVGALAGVPELGIEATTSLSPIGIDRLTS